MFIKTLIKKTSNLIYKILLLHVFIKTSYKKILFTKSDFIIIVIAFNNVDIIETQYKYLKKFLKDEFDYIIADNSSKKESSKKIKNFCENNQISYVEIPKNLLTGIRASGSHAIALNWCYKNIIRKYKPNFFGFLDHDIFPIKECSILNKMNTGFYGAIRKRGDIFWYLWPGFSFFDYDQTKKYSFNFFPHHSGPDGSIFLDTGGSNYYSIYRKVEKERVVEAKNKLINLSTEKKFIKGEDSSQTFEIIEKSWLHLRQIAWREESSNKMSNKENIIKLALENTD